MNKLRTDRGPDNNRRGEISVVETAVAYVQRRARTEHEVRKKLETSGFTQQETDYAVERLQNALLLNDELYAANYVDSRLAVKPHSRRALYTQLVARGIDCELARQATENAETGDAHNAREYAGRVMSRYTPANDENLRIIYINKTIRRLIARGYNYEDSKRAAKDAYMEIFNAYEDN